MRSFVNLIIIIKIAPAKPLLPNKADRQYAEYKHHKVEHRNPVLSYLCLSASLVTQL